ncbi:hypothetical protein SIO92_006926 [Burkholderia cenocepacia]|nr:hypothetical protein [Burkholderia cenocepacia]
MLTSSALFVKEIDLFAIVRRFGRAFVKAAETELSECAGQLYGSLVQVQAIGEYRLEMCASVSRAPNGKCLIGDRQMKGWPYRMCIQSEPFYSARLAELREKVLGSVVRLTINAEFYVE